MTGVSKATNGESVGMGALALSATVGSVIGWSRHGWLMLGGSLGLGALTFASYKRDQAGAPSRLTNGTLIASGATLLGLTFREIQWQLGQAFVAYRAADLRALQTALLGTALNIGGGGLLGTRMMRRGLAQAKGEAWAKEAHARAKLDKATTPDDQLASMSLAVLTDNSKGKEFVLNRLVHRLISKNCSSQYYQGWAIDALTRYWPELSEEERSYVLGSLQGWGIKREDLEKALGHTCEQAPPLLFGIAREDEAYAQLLEVLDIEDTPEDLKARVQGRISQLGLDDPELVKDLPNEYGEKISLLTERLQNKVRIYKILHGVDELPPSFEKVEREDDLDASADDLADYVLGRGYSYDWGLGAVAFALGLTCLSLNVAYYAEVATVYPKAAAAGAALGVLYAWSNREGHSRAERNLAVLRSLRDEITHDDLIGISIASETVVEFIQGQEKELVLSPASVPIGMFNVHSIGLWVLSAGFRRLFGPLGAFFSAMQLATILTMVPLRKMSAIKGSSARRDAEKFIQTYGGKAQLWSDIQQQPLAVLQVLQTS